MHVGRLWPITLCVLVGALMLVSCRSMPAGTSTASPFHPLNNAILLADNTAVDAQGQRHIEQEIFDYAFRLIEQAEQLVLLDMFLFNDFQGPNPETHRALAQELTQTLIAKKAAQPELPIVVITDPFNTLYGGISNTYLNQLRTAGITVVLTKLTALPDSNPSWSALWRTCCQWFGNKADAGWLPNPVGDGKVTLRTYLALINFKANHRKTLVVDEGDTWTALITSANPHDGSSAHSNTAVVASGPIALTVLQSEQAVLEFSAPHVLTQTPWPAGTGPEALEQQLSQQQQDTSARIQLITEGAIENALLAAINSAEAGEKLWLEVFYFSHIQLQRALVKAHQRGVEVNVILDPNKDAFGREKNGIPNRQVARKLHQAGISVRWCNTHGEQCHSKWLLKQGKGEIELIMGSANFTRRNLSDFNLETNFRLIASQEEAVMRRALALYQSRWNNQPFEGAQGERHYTVPYEAYEDNSRWRRFLYQVMERTGWSSF